MRPCCQPPRHVNLGAGGWWTNPKGVGLNVSYLVKNSTDARSPRIFPHTASPFFLRNSSELIGVRPTPRTSNCGFMQPSHARLYRPGISFRFVRSPEAPKIIRTHESPVGCGSCDNFSRGLAWIMADIIVSSSRCTNIAFESESEVIYFRELLCRSLP